MEVEGGEVVGTCSKKYRYQNHSGRYGAEKRMSIPVMIVAMLMTTVKTCFKKIMKRIMKTMDIVVPVSHTAV
jgi:hypothetical protein